MLRVTGIVWQSHEEDIQLPGIAYINKDVDIDEKVIKDWLFNRYGYKVKSIENYTLVKQKKG